MCYLRARNVISDPDYPPWKSAEKNIDSGNTMALRIQFDRRELTPWDENLSSGYNTLLLVRQMFLFHYIPLVITVP